MRFIGIILMIGFALSGLEQLAANNGFESERIQENRANHEIWLQAKEIQATQIAKANADAEQIIALQTGALKNCLNLPGHTLIGKAEPYQRVEACHIKQYNIESTYTIEQRLKG